jgi:hypothetical protein
MKAATPLQDSMNSS